MAATTPSIFVTGTSPSTGDQHIHPVPQSAELQQVEEPSTPSIIVTSPSEGSLRDFENSPPNTYMTPYSPPEDASSSPTSIPKMEITSFSSPAGESNQTDSLYYSDGEDYYEEYHLPNTHESAFVRHYSFRKKVQKTDINAPDADKIEGLVRTGEFVRHQSIRRRIIPEEENECSEEEETFSDEDDRTEVEDEEEYDEEFEDSVEELGIKKEEREGGGSEDHVAQTTFSDGIDEGIKEIEKYLSEENLDISYSDDHINNRKKQAYNNYPKRRKGRRSFVSANNKRLKRSCSTPAVNKDGESCIEHLKSKNNYLENAQSVQDMMSFTEFQENVSIEAQTLQKIRECLDFSSYRDLLNLSGRLTDLLSPKEVEEVLANSEKYHKYLDTEVFEALSLSYYQANPINSGASKGTDNKAGKENPAGHTPRNQHIDSGFSSPKTVTDEEKQSPPSPDDLSSGHGGSVENIQPLSLSGKVRIPAPVVHLDSSTDSKLYDSEDDSYSENFAGSYIIMVIFVLVDNYFMELLI